MSWFRRPILASTALGCVLFLSAALPSRTIVHSEHHSHHSGATHTDPLCTWFCAAGQVLGVGQSVLQAPSLALLATVPLPPLSIGLIVNPSPSSRSPPAYRYLSI